MECLYKDDNQLLSQAFKKSFVLSLKVKDVEDIRVADVS
jgi:hypothetical protein